MQSHPLEQYLADCRLAHSTKAATPETAFYSALANLLNEAGTPRDVRVHCVMGLKDQGAGMPDGGLFTPDQFSKSEGKLKPGQAAGPSRGVIECKPPKKDVIAIADTKQVSDYWNKYNQVLVTNYREFLLVGHDTPIACIMRIVAGWTRYRVRFGGKAKHPKLTCTCTCTRTELNPTLALNPHLHPN